MSSTAMRGNTVSVSGPGIGLSRASRTWPIIAGLLLSAAWLSAATRTTAADALETELSPLEAAVIRESEATVKAFNAGDAAALGSMFLETGELVDEAGTVHQGKAAISELFADFFQTFPAATLEMLVDSARPVGESLAVEEGQRWITDADGTIAQVRYVAVRARQGERWPIASYREFADNPLPTPLEALQALGWILGDWVDEGPEGRTEISFRWSDDGSFLIGDYTMSAAGAGESRSTQRIGWDAVAGQLRSWTFDEDGGFTEGRWDPSDAGWVVSSKASLPDGTAGSATLLITVKDADHFVVRGTERTIGGVEEPDFELTIARRPPQPQVAK
jgi:uncharacterized protein (TIGR02246 family)